MMMMNNKEKRFSHAPADLFPMSSDIGPPLAVSNSIHPPNYGFPNNINNNHHLINNNVNNPMMLKDPNIKKLMANEYRSSHSLNHEFSQLYISNLKNQIVDQSHTNVKRTEHSNPHQLEEMSSYKKEAIECKKQMFQMEKSISFWSECTEYWRNKWRKTRDEKNKLSDEVKQLKSRINKLEYQLQVSDEKRLRLGNEVNLLNEELSRYMYRFEDDHSSNMNHSSSRSKIKQLQQQVHYNSDRRVDYRKKHRRKKEILNESRKNIPNNGKIAMANDSSGSDMDYRDTSGNAQHHAHYHHHHHHHHSYTLQNNDSATNSLGKILPPLQPNDTIQSASSSQQPNPKIVFRQHERLFDKKIMNKKRFSQVVMLDEEEIFQMNKEIPNNSRSNNNDSTLKSNQNNSFYHYDPNDTLNTYTQNNKLRFMDYVPEDVEEEDSFDDRIKPGQFFSDDLDFDSTGVGSSTNNLNRKISNPDFSSTMATNSECYPNVSQNEADQSDNNRQNDNQSDRSLVDDQSNNPEDNQPKKNNDSPHETDDDEV